MAKSNRFEEHSIRIRSGTLVLSDLRLTGWSTANKMKTHADNGRLWGRITAANVLELWREPSMVTGTDRMCVSGAIAGDGLVTINADNSSGISGTVRVERTLGEEQLFDVIVSYADESDLRSVYAALDGELEDGGAFENIDTRFESVLKDAKKIDVDPELWRLHEDEIGLDDRGMPEIARIMDPSVLAEAQAMFAAARIYGRRVSTSEQGLVDLEMKKEHRSMAFDAISRASVAFDEDADGEPDDRPGFIQEIERG